MGSDARRSVRSWRRVACGLSLALPLVASAQVDAALQALDRKDCETVIDALNHGMTGNEARAWYVTGLLYESGTCLRADPAKAVPVYERGAELGDADSAVSLALLRARGIGGPSNYADAAYWFAVAKSGKVGAPARGSESYATPDALVRAYVEAVHDLAEQKLVYPPDAVAAGVRGKVVMRFDPRTSDVTVLASQDNQGMSMNHLGPGKRSFERALRAAYDEAMRTLPKPSLPAAGEFATEHEVRFDRDRSGSGGPGSLQDIRR